MYLITFCCESPSPFPQSAYTLALPLPLITFPSPFLCHCVAVKRNVNYEKPRDTIIFPKRYPP